MGVYPFMFGSAKDFEPVFEELVKVGTSAAAAADSVASVDSVPL